MRQRLSTLGIGFLVLVLLSMGLVSCDRSAEVREIETTAPEETPATSQPAPGGVRTLVPGETVVSAVTPSAGTVQPGSAPTQVTVGGTPGTSQSVATTAPQPTAGQQQPATQPAAPASGQGEAIVHTVQPGETLSSIAQRYGTTWQTIAQANGLVNPDQIYAGQKLTISGASSGGSSGGTAGCRIRHTVQAGEWVWQIARNYGASPYDILAANGLSIQTANTIYPGRVLCIP